MQAVSAPIPRIGIALTVSLAQFLNSSILINSNVSSVPTNKYTIPQRINVLIVQQQPLFLMETNASRVKVLLFITQLLKIVKHALQLNPIIGKQINVNVKTTTSGMVSPVFLAISQNTLILFESNAYLARVDKYMIWKWKPVLIVQLLILYSTDRNACHVLPISIIIKRLILAFLAKATRFMISQQIHAFVRTRLLFGMEVNASHAFCRIILIWTPNNAFPVKVESTSILLSNIVHPIDLQTYFIYIITIECEKN